VPKQGSATSGEACPEGARTPSLPDLAGVDLHRLRVMDDPALLAAVDEVLRRPELFADMWLAGEGGQGGHTTLRHSVPPARGKGRPGA
jgi:hypothetical protein